MSPLVIIRSNTGKERIDLFPRVDDFDDDRQILRQAKNLRGVDAGGVTETDLAAQHRRAGKVHLPRFQDDSFIQRQRPVLVIFAEKDAEQDGVMRNLHGRDLIVALILESR